MEEASACRADISKVVAACSRSVVEREGGWKKWRQAERRQVSVFVVIQWSWFGNKCLKKNFQYYGIVVRRQCRDGLGFGVGIVSRLLCQGHWVSSCVGSS
jgi:hypothetical protein